MAERSGPADRDKVLELLAQGASAMYHAKPQALLVPQEEWLRIQEGALTMLEASGYRISRRPDLGE